jgi:glyoxylase-like metal-dependent hydrolase (beta-lactamase superfamily II)
MIPPERWDIDVVWVGSIPALPLSLYLGKAPPDALIDVACFAFIVSSPQATIVVDSGPDEALAGAAGFNVVGGAKPALTRALAARGRDVRDVSTVVHTHLHYDHMQNDDLFPFAEIVVSEQELGRARRAGREEFYVGVGAFCDQTAARLHVVRSDMMQVAPGVHVVATRGHTPGHQVVVIDTEIGPVCLAGDEVPLAMNSVEPPPRAHDAAATRRFLRGARRRGWLVVPGHDPGLAHIPTIATTIGPDAEPEHTRRGR